MGYDVSQGLPPRFLLNSAGFGSIAWVGSTVALGASQTSNWLFMSSFGHAVTTRGTLDGVSLAITGTSSVVGAISDVSVRLVRLGTSSTADSGGSFAWGTSSVRQVFAGSSNLWGLTGWNINDVNSGASSGGHGWLFAVVNVSAASATFFYSLAESLVHFSVTDTTVATPGVSLGLGRF